MTELDHLSLGVLNVAAHIRISYLGALFDALTKWKAEIQPLTYMNQSPSQRTVMSSHAMRHIGRLKWRSSGWANDRTHRALRPLTKPRIRTPELSSRHREEKPCRLI
jgi:hypothetical protein